MIRHEIDHIAWNIAVTSFLQIMPSWSESYPSNTTEHKLYFLREGSTAKLSLLILFEDVDTDHKLLKADKTVFVGVVDLKYFVEDDVVPYFEVRYTF